MREHVRCNSREIVEREWEGGERERGETNKQQQPPGGLDLKI